MSARALILTYHEIGAGPPPLCLDLDGLIRHLDVIADSGALLMTVTELAAALRDSSLPRLAVALTFDDGTAGAVRQAAPILIGRQLRATIYGVAGYLGRPGRWPSLPAAATAFELASGGELAELADAGFEIGCHGFEHAPLHRATLATLRHEVLTAREVIEDAVGVRVTSFAYPYNVLPAASGIDLIRKAYRAACAGRCRLVKAGDDPITLARVDAHYVRDPALLKLMLHGTGAGYLATRRMAGRARRLIRPDFAS